MQSQQERRGCVTQAASGLTAARVLLAAGRACRPRAAGAALVAELFCSCARFSKTTLEHAVHLAIIGLKLAPPLRVHRSLEVGFPLTQAAGGRGQGRGASGGGWEACQAGNQLATASGPLRLQAATKQCMQVALGTW